MPDNLSIWSAVEKTDPRFTKQFSRGGGFKGTSTNATYLARKATETFGPAGTGWGIAVVDEQLITGAPHLDSNGVVIAHDIIHKVHAKLWYVLDGVRGEIEQFGQTQIVGKNKNGFFTDEEAPKKSLTDAMTKCLSLLGFAADIHLGLYDDNKYVNSLWDEIDGQQEPAQEPAPKRDTGPKMSVAEHTKAMQGAKTENDLKRAFALAWKQYEDPKDPAVHTPTQLKFKTTYERAKDALLGPAPNEDAPVSDEELDAAGVK